MNGNADQVVAVRLLSSRASVDTVQHAGAILAVRADVAAAWIADGLAELADQGAIAAAITAEDLARRGAAETAMRAGARGRR